MPSVRRAFLSASVGRYLVMAVNILTTLIAVRLLTPRDYGIAAIAALILGLAESVRSLAGGAYLIQKHELEPADIHTTMTISLLATIALLCVLAGCAYVLAHVNEPDLAHYLDVAVVGFLVNPLTYLITALLSRRMAFGRIAAINLMSAIVGSVITVYLAHNGYGYISLAWASAGSAITAMLLHAWFWHDWSILRFHLSRWRNVMSFGASDSATGLLAQIGEAVPYFLLGRFLDLHAVGLGQRTIMLCLFPERVVLSAVGAVALPAFSRNAADLPALARDYVRAVSLITAALWPVLLILALYAPSVVFYLFGSRWSEIAPLVSIVATALMLSFPATLQYPALVSVGAIRWLPPLMLLQVSLTCAGLWIALPHGLLAGTLSMLLTIPVNGAVSLVAVRHFLRYRWRDLCLGVLPSVLVLALCAAGPMVVVMSMGQSLAALMIGLALAGAGWLGGLLATRHPLMGEMVGVFRIQVSEGRFVLF